MKPFLSESVPPAPARSEQPEKTSEPSNRKAKNTEIIRIMLFDLRWNDGHGRHTFLVKSVKDKSTSLPGYDQFAGDILHFKAIAEFLVSS